MHIYIYTCVDVPLIRERQRQSRKFHWVRPGKEPIGKQDEILEILGVAQQPMQILPRWLKCTRWSKMPQKNSPARHLPSHSETLVRLGLGLHKILNICNYGFPQTGVSSTRTDYFSAPGFFDGFWCSKALVSCARNTHF